MFNAIIKNGTHSSWRRTKPQPIDWLCGCGEENRRYLVKCRFCRGPAVEGIPA